MATKESNGEILDTHFNTLQEDDSVQPSSFSTNKHLENYHFGKALAFRAVYGSSGFQRIGSRKIRGNDTKTSPSRLSKVTLAANDTHT